MRRVRHVDLVVVGGGPGGLSAAAAAAERGRTVLLVDQGLRLGGQIWRHRDEETLPPLAQRLITRARNAGVKIVTECRVVDAYSPHDLIIDFRGRIDRHETGGVIIATGARERFIPFPGWTLPGVTGVGGLQALLKGGMSLTGQRVVIAGSGPLLLPVAAAVSRAGARLMVVAEQARGRDVRAFARKVLRDPAKLRQAIGYRWAFRASPFRTDSWVTRAEGSGRLQSVELSERGRTRTVACDWLATGMGLVPNTELADLLHCQVEQGAIVVNANQATTTDHIWAVGECTGVKGDAAAIVEGEIAGAAAAGDLTAAASAELQQARTVGRRFAELLQGTFAPRPELRTLATRETIICRCEDVTLGAVDPVWSQRQAKLWTRLGMGACQGAVCGPACEALFGWSSNATRPPLGTPLCNEWTSGLGSGE